jgi:hypothetical protein
VRNAGIEAVQRFVRGGLGSVVRKSDLITQKEEVYLLNSDACSLRNGCGCNNRMVYFFCHNLFIRGQNELRATNANQFKLLANSKGEEFLMCVFFFFHFLCEKY